MVERVWQLVSRTTVTRAVASRPRLALMLVLLALLVATQGSAAAEVDVTTPFDGASTEGAKVSTGP